MDKDFWIVAVAGGGSGSSKPSMACGGGGAGEYFEDQNHPIRAEHNHSIVVGAGGATPRAGYGNIGYSTTVPIMDGSVTLVGGGGGTASGSGGSGGSGGGGAGTGGSSVKTIGLGNSGGSGSGGGGGGGGGASESGSSGAIRKGGDGVSTTITGDVTHWAGGGGGAGSGLNGSGGLGGGGGGYSDWAGDDGSNGGGGGASARSAGYTDFMAGKGGDGVCMIRFKTNQIDIIRRNGSTLTTIGEDTLLTWNAGSGSFEYKIITIQTKKPTALDCKKIKLEAEIVVDDEFTEKGFCWSETSGATTSDNKKEISGTAKEFDYIIENLEPNTTYYVNSYVIIDDQTHYGKEQTIKTPVQPASLPISITGESTDETRTSTILSSIVKSDIENIYEYGFVYDTQSRALPELVEPSETDYSNYVFSSGIEEIEDGDRKYEHNLTGLESGNKYYYRSFAGSCIGFSYGEELSFQTDSGQPKILQIIPQAIKIDTVERIEIIGLEISGMATIEIDGEPCTNVEKIGSSVFCDVPQSEVQKTATLKVTNPDGKSGTFPFYYMKEIPNPEPKPKIEAKLEVGIIETI